MVSNKLIPTTGESLSREGCRSITDAFLTGNNIRIINTDFRHSCTIDLLE